jgi:DHA1 family bicyclomycin/chloramphenicol resistance-like MFS transporter
MTAAAPATHEGDPHELSHLGYRLFIGLAMASSAISIDLILPAFVKIRQDFGLPADSAATAGLITAFFLGLACGPIPFGLLTDRIGRKPTVLLACTLFVVGAVAAAFAPSLALIKVARFVWGFGAAGLRVATTAMIRDRFHGAAMGREMSFAMTVFIIVPIFAPSVGAEVVKVMPWRGTFLVCAGFAVLIGLWSLRMPESLSPANRQRLDVRQVGIAASAIGRHRTSLAYTLALTALFGVFSSYLASSERIIGDVFHHQSWFPYVFGGTAVAMGLTTLLVGPSVERIGIDRLIGIALSIFAGASVVLYAVSRAGKGHPNFWLYLAVLTVVLAGFSLLNSNLNAAAMTPVGHVAGTAAALMATSSTAVGAIVGSRIDGAFDGTANPLSLAFAVAGCVALLLVVWGRGRRTASG